MKDAEDLRKIPTNYKEYLKDTVNMIGVIRWVYRNLTPEKSHNWTKRFLIALAIMTIFQMMQPWMVSHIFNGLISRDIDILWFGFTGFVVCGVVQKITNWYESRVRECTIGINLGSVDHRITELFFEKSMGQHLQEGSSLHVSNIDKGRWRVVEIMCMLLFEGVPVLLMLLVSYLFLCVLSPIAGITMTVVIATHTAWSVFLNQRVVAIGTPIDKDYRKLNRHRVERWENMERVKTCGKEAQELQEMDNWWDQIITADRKFWLWFIDQASLRGVINIVGLILVMGYGAWLVWSGSWQVGKLYPLYTWASLLSFNIWQLSKIEHQLNWNLPSVRSMMEALTIKPNIVFPQDAPLVCRSNPVRVVFDQVSYTYPIGSREEGNENAKLPVPVIKNVSLEIAAGEKVALIGDSGAGKTTLMRLLLRYMDPDEGCIHVNGHRLHEINLHSWMSLIGYIPQQPQVLDGTLRYNLTYGLSADDRQKITDDELWDLMRLLKIDFGQRLVKELDTHVGRNGMKLSGGQAQRLMIGAAAIKKPLFMVIDEATSSLDSTTEKAVQDGLTQVLSGNISALIIAHRLSTVRHLCDRFIVLQEASSLNDNQSQIETSASSLEELYEISPTFRRLADDQGIILGRRSVLCDSR